MNGNRTAPFSRIARSTAGRTASGCQRPDAGFAKLLGILIILSLSCVFVAERFFPD